jgi:hypothetical protein
VQTRTAVFLLRIRYRLSTRRQESEQFAEEILSLGFRSRTGEPEWLPVNDKTTLDLLEEISPKGNISQQERVEQVDWALGQIHSAKDKLLAIAETRAKELEATYARLRAQIGGAQLKVTPHEPDLLAVYVLLPGGGQ